MALTKCKLGEWLELREVCNANLAYGADRVRGVNNIKKLMPTKADLAGRDLSKFQIVSPGDFVFNHRTSRNGEKFSIAYNDTAEDVICTEDYVVFRVSEKGHGKILPEWLYMYFNRPEFDRYVITNSWGSSTEFFNWEDLCAVEIDLPSVPVQRKYVAVYNAMKANVESYEHGLDDLKLSCDATIEKLRKESNAAILGDYIKRRDVRNRANKCKNVMGVSIAKEFREPTSKVNKDDLSNYKVVRPREISFVQTTHNEKVFAYALNDTEDDIVVTSVNEVFAVDETYLSPEFLAIYLSRKEFDRYARFHSWGSAREVFTWNDLIAVSIPLPNKSIQDSLAQIYIAMKKRQQILVKLKSEMSGMTSVLIKGSLDEGKRK